MTKSVTFTMELPEGLEALLRETGLMDWGKVAAKSDGDHLLDFAKTLRLTREHFKTDGNAELHGLYLTGTDTVAAHTGTSPNARGRAQILTGLWNALHATVITDRPYMCQCADVPGNDKPIHRNAYECADARAAANDQPAKSAN